MKYLFKNGRLVDPANHLDGKYDVLIENGVVAKVDRTITDPEAIVEDVKGKIITPGFVETHAHIRDFNEPHRDDFYSASCAAICGGFTSICVMPNSDPVVDTPEMVKAVNKRARESAVTRIYPMAALTKGRLGEEIVDMKSLAEAGAVAFSDDGNAIKEATMMREILEKTKEINRVVCLHCEDKAYTGNGIVNLGPLSDEMNLPGISSVGEDIEIARNLIIQEEINGHMHLCHLGSERSVELVRFFKQRGVNFTCEVIPHQFSKTEQIVKEKGVCAKVKPPFRGQKDMLGLRKGLTDKLIDTIASDHCPYAEYEITKGIDGTNLFGIAGFETTLPMVLEMVRQGYTDLSYVIRCLSTNPAKIMRIPERGHLSIGADADLNIIDPDVEWVVTKDTLHSKGKNNPYLGEKVRGKVVLSMIGGEIVCRNWDILKEVEIPGPNPEKQFY